MFIRIQMIIYEYPDPGWVESDTQVIMRSRANLNVDGSTVGPDALQFLFVGNIRSDFAKTAHKSINSRVVLIYEILKKGKRAEVLHFKFSMRM